MRHPWLLVTIYLITAFALAHSAASAGDPPKTKVLPPIPLSVDEVLAWIDRSHPLLKGAGTEKVTARGKMLKALGAFEPTLINDTEVERFISSSNPGKGTQTVGFNDTLRPATARRSSDFRPMPSRTERRSRSR